MAQSSAALTFTVQRHTPEVIVPAKPTPRELKPLSDIDDQEGLRLQVPMIHFYSQNPKMMNKNPASVIREALAKVLVFYYPLAGRLKEGPTRKLMVDCTGQGVLFIEAEADVTLKEFGEQLQPPFPCMGELLYDVPGSSSILDSPLLLVQVTRLLCGGFIFAIRWNHTMCDATGLVKFMKAWSEMAHGALTPSTLPVWHRELLSARGPPRVTCTHYEYDEVAETQGTITSSDDKTQRSFFFGPAEVAALRRFVPVHLQNCSTFDVLTASIWRCRTIALQPNPKEDMRIICIMDARSKFSPPIPLGYYGNVLAFSSAISTAQDLCNKPLSHALELVIEAKSNLTQEYVRSIADLMVIKGRPGVTHVRSYAVSNLTRAGFEDIDFGWGKAIYAGTARGVFCDPPSSSSFYIPFYNTGGERGILIPICLPSVAMNKFVIELNNMLQDNYYQALQEHKSRTLSKI